MKPDVIVMGAGLAGLCGAALSPALPAPASAQVAIASRWRRPVEFFASVLEDD